MAKQWKTIEHTADVGLAAHADSLAELFEALGEGLAEQICPRRSVESTDSKIISAQAENVEFLAIEFLSKLLGLFHLDKFLIAQVRVEQITECSVRAELAGQAYDPAGHELGGEIKAVTYHQLQIARRGDKWRGQVILDT